MSRFAFKRWVRPFAMALALGAIALTTASCGKKTPEERLAEAQQLAEQRQIPLAMLKLKDLLKAAPDDPAAIEARMMLASLTMSLGRKENFEEAAKILTEVYEKATLDDERGLSAHQMVTRILFESDRYDEALAHARAGVAAARSDMAKIELGFVQAGVLLSSDNTEHHAEGEAYFKKMSLEEPNPTYRGRAREVLADYFRQNKRFDESNAVYGDYMAKYADDPVNPQLIMAQALNFRLAGDEEKSKSLFDEGAAKMLAQVDAELNPADRVSKLNDLSQLYSAVARFEEAEGILRRIMAENVGRKAAIDAQTAIGELYIRQQDWDKARAHYEGMRRENPGTSIAQLSDEYLKGIDAQVAALAAAATNTADGDTSPTIAPTSSESGS